MTLIGSTHEIAPGNQDSGLDLRSLTTLIFDLDGVIWRGDEAIEGAAASVARLREAGKRCLYCTNNSTLTQKQFADKLRGMEIELEDDDVITSSIATAMYLSAQFTGPFLVYVIGEEGIIAALQKIGAHVVADIDVTDETQVDCVVVGIDRYFNYDKLRIAQNLIHRGAIFVATNRDNTFPTENGIVPGAGAIVSSVEAASGVAPVTIGKPRPAMVNLVMTKLGLASHEVAMIGDRLDTDIACARRAGIAALFVATGVTPMQQARRGKGELRADAFFEDLPALADALLPDAPQHSAPVAAQVAAVAQGTSSGLQNAAAAQPDAGTIDLPPVEATAIWNPPVESPSAESPSLESDVSESTAAVVDTPAVEDTPPVEDTSASQEGASHDFPTDDFLTEDSLTEDATPAGNTPTDETILWDDMPADGAPNFDDAPALDDAATPGMAEDMASNASATTDAIDVDALEKWDDSWLAPDAEQPADSAPVAEIEDSAAQAEVAPFDLDFDLSLPETPTNNSMVPTASPEESNAGTPGDAAKPDEAENSSGGFNWKLD